MRFAIRAAIVSLTAGFVGGAALADDSREAAYRRFIEEHQRTIALSMHPTSKLLRAECDGSTRHANGFALTYTFRFNHFLQGDFYSRLNFAFDGDGKFTDVTTNATSAIVPPFAGSTLAMNVLSELVAEELELKDDHLLKKAMDAADARTVVTIYLAHKHAASPAVAPAATDAELIRLIRGSQSMDDEDRAYWIRVLPVMSSDQRSELRKILVEERDALRAIDEKYRAAVGQRRP